MVRVFGVHGGILFSKTRIRKERVGPSGESAGRDVSRECAHGYVQPRSHRCGRNDSKRERALRVRPPESNGCATRPKRRPTCNADTWGTPKGILPAYIWATRQMGRSALRLGHPPEDHPCKGLFFDFAPTRIHTLHAAVSISPRRK